MAKRNTEKTNETVAVRAPLAGLPFTTTPVKEDEYKRLSGIPVVRLGVDMLAGQMFEGRLVRIDKSRKKSIKSPIAIFLHASGVELAFPCTKVFTSALGIDVADDGSVTDNGAIGKTLCIKYTGTKPSPTGKDYHCLDILEKVQ